MKKNIGIVVEWRSIFGVNWEMWLFQRKLRIHMSLFTLPKQIMKRVEVRN